MSSKGAHVQDNSVVERRLRPIYDWLDMNNHKKALQECDKVLKKTPKSQCARALKALTLHRLGNRDSEVMSLLDQLCSESPTDEATLQAMALSYRELQRLDKVCMIYETAVKVDPHHEELATHLFMSYARIFDFKAQHKAAMALYKSRPKTPYYCWTVMSLVLQATRGEEAQEDPKKRTLLLNLAEKMMEKLIADNKAEAEQEIQLYVMILELLQKWDSILTLLEGPLGAKMACSGGPEAKLKYLIKLERWREVNLVCKKILNECVDKWDIWKTYIESVIKLQGQCDDEDIVDNTPDKCHDFICSMIETLHEEDGSLLLLRAPYLARFELCCHSSDLLGEPIELFVEYFRKFGHKPCCVSDLRLYVKQLLDENKRGELAVRLMKEVGLGGTTSVPQDENQMQRHLCALQLSRLSGAHKSLAPDHQRALVAALSLHYQHGHQTYGQNLLPTDLGPADPYILLAVHVLSDLSQSEQSGEPLVQALVLLHELLRNSPSNFHAKLLAIRIYHMLGGALGAQGMYNSLDAKHLQLDSLGFVHCAHLGTTGIFSMCSSLWDVVLKFFSANYQDSSDYLTFSYKYGSFVKLDEFMDFRERIRNSSHYLGVAIDRAHLAIVECQSLDDLYTSDVIAPPDHYTGWDTLWDNQDHEVYIHWEPDGLLEGHVDSLFDQQMAYHRLRDYVVRATTLAIDLIKGDHAERPSLAARLRETIDEWERADMETRLRHTVLEEEEPRINHVTWPLGSRLDVALATPHFGIVASLFLLLCDTAEGACGDSSRKVVDWPSALRALGQSTEERLVANATDDLIGRRETMEYAVNCVEVMSMSCVVCLLCNELSKPPRGVGKKSKKGPIGGGGNEALRTLGREVAKCTRSLRDAIRAWSDRVHLSRVKAKSNVLEQEEEGDDVNIITSEAKMARQRRAIYDKMADSHNLACEEIELLLRGKVDLMAAAFGTASSSS